MGTIREYVGKKEKTYTATVRLKGYPVQTETFLKKLKQRNGYKKQNKN